MNALLAVAEPVSTGAPAWATLGYLVTAGCFITGIKMLGSPATARRGNFIAGFGMLVALVVTLSQVATTDSMHFDWAVMGIAVLIGTAVGGFSARAVRMTAMPQMVALFNGMGAGAAALIGIDDFRTGLDGFIAFPGFSSNAEIISVLVSCFIGSLSFSGSVIAFGKLQELISGRAVTYPLQRPLNGLLLLAIIGLGAYIVVAPSIELLFIYIGITLLLGILFVIPVGGADMPVIISLLNSCTGLAAAATGFVLGNNGLIVSGALVGASGFILTQQMSKAMNRSLFNVLFGAFGQGAGQVASTTGAGGGTVRSTTSEDLAPLLAYSRLVIIVPGYGMAVARAQNDVKELADELERRGVEVKYAIHPVAGRMPGHMNVLLAEANVPYPQLREMDDINPEFARADVAIVIGANDVVNPAARNDPGSPIYGMPILNVDQAQTTVVLKRSMATGFAGVDNPLFYEPKTLMLFGDARASIVALTSEVKQQ